MPKKKKKAPAPEAPVTKTEAAKKCAILFELENVAMGGRQMVFDVLKKELAGKGIKLTPPLFSRYCLAQSFSHGVGELLESGGKGRMSEEKLASHVVDEVKSVLLNESVTVAPGVKKLLKRAAAKGVAVGALSCFDSNTARQLLGKLKLEGEISAVLPYACDEKNHPSADAWLKLARNLSMTSGVCVAVATSAISAKAALTSSMKCVAVTDPFTRYQDFGGADCVADALDDPVLDTIFSLLDVR
jgi:beta-phosphoglucomutase-like phosphatase (HAD superfamily)